MIAERGEREPGDGAHESSPRRFAIDLEGYQGAGRSLERLLRDRRCLSCRESLERQEAPATTEEHLQSIANCCSKKEGYVGVGMPTMEALFRILLADGNVPQTASEIHQKLSTHLETRLYGRILPVEWVERMLLGRNRYAIRPTDG